MPIRGKKMADVKVSNRKAILKTLHKEGTMSRKGLAQSLSLTRAAITMIVNEMIEEGILYESDEIIQARTSGRREINLEINTKRHIALGVSLNIDEYILSAATLSGELLSQERLEPEKSAKAETIILFIAKKLLAFANKYTSSGKQIVGLGVSIRGIVDKRAGVSIDSLGMWEQKNVPIRYLLEQVTPWGVIVDNNVRSIAYAQMFLTNMQDDGDILFVRSEHGIGAAVSIDYRLIHGNHYRSAELGHVCVERNGLPCACGGYGCLETVASYKAVIALSQNALDKKTSPVLYALCNGEPNEITFDMVDEAAEKCDEPIKAIWERAIQLTAETIKTTMRLIDSQKIILYGRMFENNRYFNELQKCLMSDTCFGAMNTIVENCVMNQVLDLVAAPIIAVKEYFDFGGLNIDSRRR